MGRVMRSWHRQNPQQQPGVMPQHTGAMPTEHALDLRAVTFALRWFIAPIGVPPFLMVVALVARLLLSIPVAIGILALFGVAAFVVRLIFETPRWRTVGWSVTGASLAWVIATLFVPWGPVNPWLLLVLWVPFVFGWAWWCMHFRGLNKTAIAEARAGHQFASAASSSGLSNAKVVHKTENDYIKSYILHHPGYTYKSLDTSKLGSLVDSDHGSVRTEKAPKIHPETGRKLGSSYSTVRVVIRDPHAKPIAFPLERLSHTGTTNPPFGLFEDGEEYILPAFVNGDPQRDGVAGETGAGKSGYIDLNVLWYSATIDTVILGYDMKGGQCLSHWRGVLGRYTADPHEAHEDWDAIGRIIDDRARRAAANGWEHWPVSPENPLIVAITDETWKLVDGWYDRYGWVAAHRQGRSVGVRVLDVNQTFNADDVGGTDIKHNIPNRICFRGPEALSDQVLHNRFESARADEIPRDRQGTCIVQCSLGDRPAHLRQFFVDPQMKADHNRSRANRQAWISPEDIAAAGRGWEQPYSRGVVLGSAPTIIPTGPTTSAARPAPAAPVKEDTMPDAKPPVDLMAGPSPYGQVPPLPDLPMPKADTPPQPKKNDVTMSKREARQFLVDLVNSGDEGKVWTTAELLRPLEQAANCKDSWSYARLKDVVQSGQVKRAKAGKYRRGVQPAEPAMAS